MLLNAIYHEKQRPFNRPDVIVLIAETDPTPHLPMNFTNKKLHILSPHLLRRSVTYAGPLVKQS